MKYAVEEPLSKVELIVQMLAPKVFLKIKVQLNSLSSSNDSKMFDNGIKLYKYGTNKYDDVNYMLTEQISFTPYFVIEYPSETDGFGKEFVYLKPANVLDAYGILNNFIKNIMDHYKYDNNRGWVVVDESNVSVMIDSRQSIRCYPDTTTIKVNGSDSVIPTIRTVLNDNYICNISINNFKTLLYCLRQTDLYGIGATLLSTWRDRIIKSIEPITFGSRVYNTQSIPDKKNTVSFKSKSVPITEEEKKRSFFDD